MRVTEVNDVIAFFDFLPSFGAFSFGWGRKSRKKRSLVKAYVDVNVCVSKVQLKRNYPYDADAEFSWQLAHQAAHSVGRKKRFISHVRPTLAMSVTGK